MESVTLDVIISIGGRPMKCVPLSLILPLAASIFVVIWGGGIGVSFILLSEAGLEEFGAIVGGIALVVGVPAVAALLTMPKRE